MTYSREKWKEIIVTDYLDGELDEQARCAVEEAMAKDPELQEYWAAVQKTAQEPFQNLYEPIPAERLWGKIKAEIEADQVEQPWW